MFSKFKAFTSTNNLSNFNKFISKGIQNNNPQTKVGGASKFLTLGLFGLGAGGLAYVSYHAGKARDEHLKTLLSTGTRVSPKISLQRTKDTVTYFGSGLGLTSLMTYAMSRSEKFMLMNLKIMSHKYMFLILTIPAYIFAIYGMSKTPSVENTNIKHGCWLLFNGLMAFTISPLVVLSGAKLVTEAALITGGAVGGLSYVSYIAKNDSFLGMNGFLAAGSGVMCACAMASFFTNSPVINNIWLYGGLALFLAYILYDVQQIKIKAENQVVYDPLRESLHLYMDTINIFIRVLMILNDKKNKK